MIIRRYKKVYYNVPGRVGYAAFGRSKNATERMSAGLKVAKLPLSAFVLIALCQIFHKNAK
jgi:hypothetical protein